VLCPPTSHVLLYTTITDLLLKHREYRRFFLLIMNFQSFSLQIIVLGVVQDDNFKDECDSVPIFKECRRH
jgi:hypothetical protein